MRILRRRHRDKNPWILARRWMVRGQAPRNSRGIQPRWNNGGIKGKHRGCIWANDGRKILSLSSERIVVPTILVLLGWRLFFYANEGNEPMHVHCRKGERECKYWIDEDNFDIRESYSYNLSPSDKKQIRKIIFSHFDYIVDQWNEFQKRRQRWISIIK